MAGYVKLHRRFLEWEWFDDMPACKLFITLLLTVNYTDKKWHGEDVRRGELITSLQHLAESSGLSVQQVRTALEKLVSTGEIEVTPTQRYSRIKVLNYAKYQDSENDEQQTDNKLITNSQQTDNKLITNSQQQLNKDNKGKKERREEISINESIIDASLIPFVEAVKDYSLSIGYTDISPASFVKYMSIVYGSDLTFDDCYREIDSMMERGKGTGYR